MRQAASVLAELTQVDQEASTILSRGLEDGEKGILQYVTSDACSDVVRLDPNWDDAGYQVFLLALTIKSDVPCAYVAQYKKYKSWVVGQNNNPEFYWNSGPLDLTSVYIASPYANYIRSTSVQLITELRTASGPLLHCKSLDIVTQQQEALERDKGDESYLIKVAQELARMKRCPSNETNETFGTVAAMERSVLYNQIRTSTSDHEIRSVLKQFLPCLAPDMDQLVYDSVIEDACKSSGNPRLLLAAIRRYESILRDIMEAEGLGKFARIYDIGHRTSRHFDRIARGTEAVCDVLEAERLRVRFLEMRHQLRRERVPFHFSYYRHAFLRTEHKRLLEQGASDLHDYVPTLRELHAALIAFSDDSSNAKLAEECIRALDNHSYELQAGILECLRSIGTDKISLSRLI